MTIQTDKKKRREFEKFMNKQFKILEGHHSRIMLRVWNKYAALNSMPSSEGEELNKEVNKNRKPGNTE